MWCSNPKNLSERGFITPPATWRRSPHSTAVVGAAPMSERNPSCRRDLFHVIHKVPAGDSPYVKAKHVQLIEKDPSRAISLFWAAINAGDRVDSALKDMAVVMKQLNRSNEAIEAIKSFRHLCSYDAQESLDNVLVELYKRSGRTEEEIEVLQHRLKIIEEGIAFGGNRTKTARSQGKKIQITADQEKARILGNLAWAYLQQHNYGLAEQHYRKALSLEPDKNKQCNLAICLIQMNRITEAKSLLQAVKASCRNISMDESFAKSFERAFQMLTDLQSQSIEQKEDNKRSTVLGTTNVVREVSISNGDERHVAGLVCTNGANEVAVMSTEQSTESYGGNHSVYEKTFFEYNKRSSHFTSTGMRGSHPSRQAPPDRNWWKGCYFESPNERPGHATKMKENWRSSTGTTMASAKKNTFSSPPAFLYTQPRNSWGSNKGDERRNRWGVDRIEQPQPSMLEHATQNLNKNFIDSDVKKSGSQCSLPSPADRDWRRKDGRLLQPYTQPRRVDGQRKETYWDDDYENAIVRESDSQHVQSRNAQENGGKMEKITVVQNERMRFDGSGVNESLGTNYSTKTPHKSWADMVEEEEEELQQRSFDYRWNHNEEYYDENVDSNIIHDTPDSKSSVETMSRKLESIVHLNDVTPSRNRAVRRSLSFEGSGGDSSAKRSRLPVFRDITPTTDSP